MSNVYIIKAQKKSSAGKDWWFDLGFCLTKEDVEKACKNISKLNPNSNISYYIVESDKEIFGYNNGTGDIFISLTKSHKMAGDDGYINEINVFNSRKEAYDYTLKREKEDRSIWHSMDDIIKYDDYNVPISGTYTNW